MKKESRIKYFPISFFSIVMGLAGLTIAFQKAELIFKIPLSLSPYLLVFTVAFFVIITIVYLFKIIKFLSDVKEEFNHPVKLSFFPTFSISLLLLSIAFLSVNLPISRYLWIFGSLIHLIFTIKIISAWVQHSKFEIEHMNPAWFIPAVGNILIPIAGVSHFNLEISWFFFSVGFMFWVILLALFFNRIIFHEPLSDKLLPTLFILIAPPATGFISYVKLTGGVNDFAKILYYFAIFLVILLISQIKMFYQIKYYLSWWAYSFPVAAITIASILMFDKTGLSAFKYISLFFFISLNIIIVLLLVRTIITIFSKGICIEEN